MTATTTTTPTLWRLAMSGEQPIARPEALALGLRRHLAVGRLRAAIVQIGDRQQAYLALDGCPGCAYDRCDAGCHAEALRRTLRAAAGHNLAISLVRSGLAPRPYTRRYALRPLPHCRGVPPALSGVMLRQWPEGRLTVAWAGVVTGQAIYTAWLYLGLDGPDPRASFAELGWQATPRPLLPGEKPGARLAGELGLLRLLTRPIPWAGDPWLPLPTIECRACLVHAEGESNTAQPAAEAVTAPAMPLAAQEGAEGESNGVSLAQSPARTATARESAAGDQTGQEADQAAQALRALHARLADHLTPIVAGKVIFARRGELASVVAEADTAKASQATAAPQPPRAESIWPKGPGAGKGTLWPAVLEAFFASVLAPQSPYHSPDGPGLTYRRVLDALGERHAEQARALMVWLEQANLLIPPAKVTQPWEGARLLATHMPAEIAERLRQTPHPSGEALELANKQGLNKRQGQK